MSKKYLSLFVILFFLACKAEEKENSSFSHDPALDQYHTAIKLSPRNDTLYYERAAYYYQQERYADAVQDLNKAISLNPNMPVYYNLLSDAYFDLDAMEESIGALKKLTEMVPGQVGLQLKLAEVLWIDGQFTEALNRVDKALEIDPQQAEAFFMKGLIQLSQKDTTAALIAFKNTLDINPNHVDALLETGKIHSARRDPRTMDVFNTALLIDRTNVKIREAKADHLMKTGDLESAIKEYKSIIRLDKFNHQAFLNSGVIYMQLDSITKAIDQFSIATEIQSEDGLAYYYRGLCYKLVGDLEKAKKDFEQCLVLLPDWEEAQVELNTLQE